MKKLVTLFLALTATLFVVAQPGSIDLTYTPGTGFNAYVFSTAMQNDGKLVVAGGYSTFNGTSRNSISRLNTDGTLDMSFNPGTGFNNWVLDVKIQPDGKIVVVGFFTSFNGTPRNRIARLNADGTLDTSFDPGTGFNAGPMSLDIQTDGKIITVGEFTTFNGTGRNRIARINADGTLDTGFDPGTGFNGNAQVVKIQPDGKMLIGARDVGGAFTSYNGTAMNRIIRLNTDATIDLGFTIGTGCNAGVAAFEIQDDSKILVGGSFTNYNGTAVNRIMRLNDDGTFDVTFNVGSGTNSDVRTIEILSDGTSLIAGTFTLFNGATANRIIKLNTNGGVDANFSPGTAANSEINSISIQSDNKIIIGGDFTSYNGTAINRIARLNNCINTFSTDYQSSCGDYIWIDGNTYTTSNTSATHTILNLAGCDSLITLNLVITNMTDETVSTLTPEICENGAATISTGSSENGILYYLRDDTDDSVIDGPIDGDGSALDFSTGSISSTTSYNVYAETLDHALDFDGVDDEAQVDGPDFSGSSFTIEFWGRRNSLAGNDFFVGQGIIGTNVGLHIGFRPSNQFTFAFFNNDLNTPVYTDFDWHHWAMTYNATTNVRRIYRDGIVVASDIATGDYTGVGDLFLGDLTWGAGNIDGNMDELRVWNTDKSNVEVQSLMNSCLAGDENGLMAYYKFDSPAGTTTVTDNSVNGLDGVLVNMDANLAWQNGVGCSCSIEMTDIVTITVNYPTAGVDYQSACDSYLWIDGNTYTSSNTTATHTLTNAAGCDSVVTLNLLVTAINDEVVTPSQSSLCDNGSVTISTANSSGGIQYYLRDDSDDSVIDGPFEGDGSNIDFSTGTISSTTTYNVYAENIESSLEFDGVFAEAQIPGIDISNSSFTIEFWGRRNSNTGQDYFIGQGTGNTNEGLHIGFRPTNEFTFAFWFNDLNTPPVTDFDWHHWSMTYNAVTNERVIYQDGIMVASDVATADYIGTGDLYLGDTPWGGSNLGGNIDELRIWSGVRTQTQIQNTINACLTGDESGMIAYYKFDELSGTSTVNDMTANNYDGILASIDVNTAWQSGMMSCGCSSEMTDIVTITVNNSNTGTDVQAACDVYVWIDGITYTADNNTAQFILTNMAGCDSLVTLNLTINASPTAGAVNNGDGTLAATGTGTYQWIDCGTNTLVIGATTASFTPTANGDYAVIVTSGSCDDTSACINYSSVGLAENNNSVLTAYPNPTTGLITINSNNAFIASIVVRDAAGRTIYQAQNTSSTSSVDLSEMESGIYFITIFDVDNAQTTIKVTKQ